MINRVELVLVPFLITFKKGHSLVLELFVVEEIRLVFKVSLILILLHQQLEFFLKKLGLCLANVHFFHFEGLLFEHLFLDLVQLLLCFIKLLVCVRSLFVQDLNIVDFLCIFHHHTSFCQFIILIFLQFFSFLLNLV